MKTPIKRFNRTYATNTLHVFHEDTIIKGADRDSFEALSEEYARDKHTVYKRYRPIKADVETFEVLAGYFTRDKNRVYYNGEEIPTADPASFEILVENYAKDKDHYFYGSSVLDVDRETFEVLNGEYARDQHHIYSRWKVLTPNRDNSFRPLGEHLAKDSKQVYWYGSVIENVAPDDYEVIDGGFANVNNTLFSGACPVKGVDINSFEAIKNHFFKDKNHVYGFGSPIKQMDPETFEILPSSPFICFGRDKNRVYELRHEVNVVEGADPKTFELLDGSFSRDQTNLFNHGRLHRDFRREKPEKLPRKFETIWYPYAKDENNQLYYRYQRIKTADFDSFEIIDNNYSKDKNQVYYGNWLLHRIIEKADPLTFETLNKRYSKDNQQVYFDGKVIQKADPATFRFLNERNQKGELKYKNYAEDDHHVFHEKTIAEKDPRQDKKVVKTQDYQVAIDNSQHDLQITFKKENEGVYLEVLDLILQYIRKINRSKDYIHSLNLQFTFPTPKPYLPGGLPKISANQFFYEISKYKGLHKKMKNFYNLVADRHYWYAEVDPGEMSTCLGMFVSAALAFYSERNLMHMIDWLKRLDWEHHCAQFEVIEALYDQYPMSPLMMNMLGYSMMSYNSVCTLPEKVRREILADPDYLHLFFEKLKMYEKIGDLLPPEELIRGLFPEEDHKAKQSKEYKALVKAYEDFRDQGQTVTATATVTKRKDKKGTAVTNTGALPGKSVDIDKIYDTAWQIQEKEGFEKTYFNYLKDRLPIDPKYKDIERYTNLLNHLLIAAHAIGEIEFGIGVADAIQEYAHLNNYIFHSAACLYVAGNQYEKAIAQIALAEIYGYPYMKRIKTDSDLKPLFEDQRFKQLLKGY